MHKLELKEQKTQTIAHKNIESVKQFHSLPLHSSPHGQTKITLGTNAG